ncbi:hypothetical protein B4U80_07693 [Leptotrombidium deliense]|uniref:Uncharacterized protein n=1 Tax=Leptotrombidium deliense TaxID=299467 RepID=A0A443SL83_9ACAR|nr:hypothetical protein B4U80_07693 [Leptotrombidium deliense]
MIVGLLVLSLLAFAEPAAVNSVKREEYTGSGSSSNSNNNSPVYSPSSSSSYSSSATNNYPSSGYSRDSNSYQSVSSPQYATSNSGDHVGSASSNSYQSQSQSNPNLYYYYYPVQDKPKDTTFQVSSSNQYASAVSPSNDVSNQHSLESAGGQDLNYGGQDLSYSAQNIAQNIGQGLNDYNSQGNNYDQTLSSLASQLQSYGIGTGSSGNTYNPANSYTGSGSSYPSANSYGIASDASSSGYGTSGSASGHIPTYGTAVPYPGPSSSYLQPSGPYPSYGGSSYGNYAAASGQHATYEPAAGGYRRYGIGSIIMPMLALAGLSLLIPTVTSLGTAAGRKRRSTDKPKDSALGNYLNRLERYYSLYKTAVEKEECMNRIFCELGDAMSNVRGKSAFFTVVEKLVPNWMGNKIGVLKNGALSPEYGKCKKYSCQ